MLTKCVTNRSGYEYTLEVGKEYTVLDIQDGIFGGDYYVKVDRGEGKTATALLHRFNITKEIAEKYVSDKYGENR